MDEIFNFAKQQMSTYSDRFGAVNPMQQDIAWGCKSLCSGSCSGSCSTSCSGSCAFGCSGRCSSACSVTCLGTLSGRRGW